MDDTGGAIVILDDKQTILDILKEGLEEFGYETEIFISGQDALAFVTESTPIVISDIRMPEMTGLDVLREVKKKSPHTEVILMTGYASMESAVEALNLGAYCYLNKPFVFEEVKASIDKAFERRNLRLHNERLLKDLSRLNVELQDKVKELRCSNEELKKTQQFLIEKEKLETKARFVVSLNHEIVGRVQAIMAGTSYLKTQIESRQHKRIADEVNMIEAEASGIARIIKNLEEMDEFKVIDYVEDIQMIELSDNHSAKKNKVD